MGPVNPSGLRVSPRKFAVFVDDNFHYMDESHRYLLKEFETYEEATQACRRIVDEFLAGSHRPGMLDGDLYAVYAAFGEDPFISPDREEKFSAREYARRRCTEICILGGVEPDKSG